jgi:exodeoxyribonuclease X
MTIRCIDIETTGTDAAKDKIIEIASVDLTKDGGYTNPMQTFVACDMKIPPEVSAIHHLINDDLKGAPALQEALERFKGATVYVAHNAKFERSFFGAQFGPWVCTFKGAVRVWPEAPGHSNQTLRYWLGLIDVMGVERAKISPHRALSDVIVTGGIMHRLMAQASFADLKAWAEVPALLPRISFGKHRGKKFSDLERSYVDWLLKQPDMDEDVKHSARESLKKS